MGTYCVPSTSSCLTLGQWVRVAWIAHSYGNMTRWASDIIRLASVLPLGDPGLKSFPALTVTSTLQASLSLVIVGEISQRLLRPCAHSASCLPALAEFTHDHLLGRPRPFPGQLDFAQGVTCQVLRGCRKVCLLLLPNCRLRSTFQIAQFHPLLGKEKAGA